MQMWEFCICWHKACRFWTPTNYWVVEIKRDKALGDKDDDDAKARFVKWLLAEGWEPFSTTTGPHLGEESWAFKRPAR